MDDLSEALQRDPSNARAYAYRGLSCQALKQSESALSDFANAVRLDGRYAAAYCNQRAAMQAARGEYEQAAADYSLVLLFDPGNNVAKDGRDQALRALLTRPAPRSEPVPEPLPAPAPPPQPAERAEPAAAPTPPKQTRSTSKVQPKPKKAPKTEVVLKAAAPDPTVEIAAPSDEPQLVDESTPDFEVGRRRTPPAPAQRTQQPASESFDGLQLLSDGAVAEEETDTDAAERLLMEQPDSEEELSRLERQKEERRAEAVRAAEEERVGRLAAERQRMLDEVKRQKAEIDRARRAKKKPKPREEYDPDRTPWSVWAIRGGVAAHGGVGFLLDLRFHLGTDDLQTHLLSLPRLDQICGRAADPRRRPRFPLLGRQHGGRSGPNVRWNVPDEDLCRHGI